MASSLFALLDDIATLLDDVALLTKAAAQKTAGVVGDDLALNAQQLTGLAAQRELPVVWAVAKGSLRNKAILVPLALLLSQLAPWAITPLLVLGGAYLCFEGCEKLAHSVLHSAAEREAHAQEVRMHVMVHSEAELLELERSCIRGAIRTDFVLSSEIIVIALGIVQGSDWQTQLVVLSAVALLLTVGVYGLVAGIVKLDDVGMYWSQRAGNGIYAAALRQLGVGLVHAAPWLMRVLTVVGTAAMFMVGGGILVHGVPWLHGAPQLLSGAFGAAPPAVWHGVLTVVGELLVGMASGAVILLAITLWTRLRQRNRKRST